MRRVGVKDRICNSYYTASFHGGVLYDPPWYGTEALEMTALMLPLLSGFNEDTRIHAICISVGPAACGSTNLYAWHSVCSNSGTAFAAAYRFTASLFQIGRSFYPEGGARYCGPSF